MIEGVLLDQAAADAGITVSDEELDQIIQTDIDTVGGRDVFVQRLATNDLSEEEYREKVRANLVAQQVQMQLPGEIPATIEHVHARHILVGTQDEAEAILAQLRDGADFVTLAQTYSLDVSTRDQGGDLGFFPRGLLLAPELEEAAFALAPAQISDVVHSQLLGYHIVQVLEREERPVDEQNAEVIQANQIRRWRQMLWADASIERYVEP
jgi:parvulin-like peptidyl-prolyl isomerase